MESLITGSNFEAAIRNDPEIARMVSQEQLTELFDPANQLVNVDTVFERLGLLEPAVTS
jgi:hypothetical protein